MHKVIVDIFKETGKWNTCTELTLPDDIDAFETDRVLSYVAQTIDYYNRFRKMYLYVSGDEPDFWFKRIFTPEHIDKYYGAYEMEELDEEDKN